MKERPILFNGPMVRAILLGLKTQDRRVINPQPVISYMSGFQWRGWSYGLGLKELLKSSLEIVKTPAKETKANFTCACPFGQPRDRLWVQEDWRVGAWRGRKSFIDTDWSPMDSRTTYSMEESHLLIAVDYRDGPLKTWRRLHVSNDWQTLVSQSLDDAHDAGLVKDSFKGYSWEPGESPCRWRDAKTMPRWASRITLEITNVRVERLHEISEKDAIAEGIEGEPYFNGLEDGINWRDYLGEHDPPLFDDPFNSYRSLWACIYAKNPGQTWEDNPWVWVVEFRKVSQ